MEFDLSWLDPAIAELKKTAGNEHYKAQNYVEALKCYSEAIASAPNNAIYYGNRSACLFMMGDYKGALNDSQYAVTIDDKFSKGYERIIKCCLALGDIVTAEQTIEKVTNKKNKIESMKDNCRNYKIQCKRLRLYNERIADCHSKQNFKRAIFHIDNALKISVACLKTNLLKAECLIYLGRMREAYDIIDRYMKSDPSNYRTTFTYGLYLYYKTDSELDECLGYFKQAFALNPDYDKAISIWQQVNKLKQMKGTGIRLFKEGAFRKAYEVYTEALKIVPLSPDSKSKLLFNRALMSVKLGNIRDAIADCTDSLKINRTYLKAILLRARCHNDLLNYKDCIKDYKAALKISDSHQIEIALIKAKFDKARMEEKQKRKYHQEMHARRRQKKKDYYEMLDINRNANANDIRRAYKKLALKHHPDRHVDATEDVKREHERIFKEIGQAYEVLSDPRKREQYDFKNWL